MQRQSQDQRQSQALLRSLVLLRSRSQAQLPARVTPRSQGPSQVAVRSQGLSPVRSQAAVRRVWPTTHSLLVALASAQHHDRVVASTALVICLARVAPVVAMARLSRALSQVLTTVVAVAIRSVRVVDADHRQR